MPIVEQDLLEARSSWGDGILKISEAFEYDSITTAISVASSMLDDLYGFKLGQVLFKPTLSGGKQTFRPTKEGALSYFVGHNPKYPLDTGFGIKPWREVSSNTSAFFIEDQVAMWMGWVTFTDKNGQLTKVDKSWCYKLDNDGALKIMLHHSSLPYEP